MIDLNQPWLQVLIDKHVETEDLEALRVLEVVWHRRAEGLVQLRLACEHCLHDQVLYLSDEGVRGLL